MKIVNRKNFVSGLNEEWLQTEGTLLSIEPAKEPSSGGKTYHHFTANINDAICSGTVFDGVIKGRVLNPGDSMKFEASVADLEAGTNNHWAVSFLTADDVSSGILDFLANRK